MRILEILEEQLSNAIEFARVEEFFTLNLNLYFILYIEKLMV
jgi:hypothetical protein